MLRIGTLTNKKPGTDEPQWKNYPIHTSLFSHPLMNLSAVVSAFGLPLLEISETITDFIIGIVN